MKKEKLIQILSEHAKEVNSFEIKEFDENSNIINVEAQYKFPFVREMTNPFTAESMLIVYDKDEEGVIQVTQINLLSKDNLDEARTRCFPFKEKEE